MALPRTVTRALWWLGRGLVVVGLTLGLAECGVRVAGLSDGAHHRPRLLENEKKTWALECYPTEQPPGFPVDLSDPLTRAEAEARGVPDLDEAARTTPHCVSLRYNAHTRRDDPFTPVEGASVLVVGDSFTEGAGVEEPYTFTRRLGAALGPEVRVWNGGRRGQDQPGVAESLEVLLPAVEPDLVVYALVLNDFELDPAWAERQAWLNDLILDRQHMDSPTWKLPAWARHSRLVTVGAAAWRSSKATAETRAWYLGMVGPDNAGGWARTRGDLDRMDAASRAAGARLLIALVPLLYGVGEDYPFAPVHAAILEACAAQGLDCVDLAPAFAGHDSRDLWVHPVDMHPNREGHRIIAAALAPVVEDRLGAAPEPYQADQP